MCIRDRVEAPVWLSGYTHHCSAGASEMLRVTIGSCGSVESPLLPASPLMPQRLRSADHAFCPGVQSAGSLKKASMV